MAKIPVTVTGEQLEQILGISDITAAVDNRSKAVLAAEEFAACQCRCEMLKGQLKAEQERLHELCDQASATMEEAIVEACK